MLQGKNRKILFILILTIILTIIVTTIAIADDIQADGDIVTTGNQPTVNLGNVTPGATINTSISFQLKCDQKKHVDNNQTVNLDYDSDHSVIPGGSLNATNTTIGNIPETWPDDGDECGSPGPENINDNGDSTVTIIAPTTPGDYQYKVRYSISLIPAGDGDPQAIQGNFDGVTYNLTVTPPACTEVSITSSPTSQTTTYGDASVSFSAAADGNPVPTMQWQVSTDGGAIFTNIVDATSSPLTITSPTVAMNGNQYRAVFTNECGGTKTATTSAATLNVDKADANCTITGYDVTYDGNPHTATGTCLGVDGEELEGLYLAQTTHTDAGYYEDDPWTFTDVTGNYNDITDGTVDDNIDKADAICTITGYDVTYDGNPHTATGTCLGVDDEELEGLELTQTTHTDAGYYEDDPWTFTDSTGNYNDITDGTVDDNIDKAPVTMTAGSYSGTYDGISHDISSCVVTADAPNTYKDSLTCTNSPASVKNAGSGTVTPSMNYGTELEANYTVTSENGAWEIAKATLTVTADDQTIIFGEPLPTFTFQYSGFVNGETASVIDNPPTCNVAPILKFGEYPIVCSGGDDNNYKFSYVNGTLTVEAWTLKGFYQPVDMGENVFNTVKGGSTVPLKFEIFAGTSELTDINSIASFTYVANYCSSGTTEEPIEQLATGATSLRYDPIAGQFIFNWKTPKTTGCYKVTLITLDGSSLVAYFKLK